MNAFGTTTQELLNDHLLIEHGMNIKTSAKHFFNAMRYRHSHFRGKLPVKQVHATSLLDGRFVVLQPLGEGEGGLDAPPRVRHPRRAARNVGRNRVPYEESLRLNDRVSCGRGFVNYFRRVPRAYKLFRPT